jgi:drug/metabolite transporter (DMT)-like permease
MAILLAITAAVGWGTADFVGGASQRATSVFVIVAISELLGLVALVALLIARGAPVPDNPRLLLAIVAGLGVTVELSLIYGALSRGAAFITAPVGALGAAIAVTAGVIGGDPLTLAIAAGLLCAVIGGGLSAWTSRTGDSQLSTARTATVCVGAAAGVATMLVTFHAAGRVDPVWATATEHASTGVSAGLIALATSGGPRRRRLPQRRQLPALILIGLAGAGGDVAYAAASHHGALSIVSALSSLYPITTITLGLALQHHRLGRIQSIGILLALVGAAVLGAATG